MSKKISGGKKVTKSELKKLIVTADKRAALAAKTVSKKTMAPTKAAARKAPLIKNPTPRAPAAPPATPSDPLTVVALRARARAAGIVGYSRMRKDDLIAHLAAH